MDNYNDNIDENVEIDETNSPKLGNVVHSAGNAAKNTGKVVNTSGKAVQAGGKVVENSGKLVEKGGQLTQKAGQGIQKGGDALINAGNAASSSGVGAIAGVPLTILGGLTKGIGVATDVAGKGMEYGGKGVEYAGKGINKTGQGISNVGQKTQNIGQKTSQATTPSQSEKVHSVEDSIDKAAQTTNKIKKNKTIIIIVCACTVPIIIMFAFMMLTAFASLSDNEAFANFPKYDESMYNSATLGIDYDCNLTSITISHDYCSAGQSCRAHNANDISIAKSLPSPNIYPLLEGEVVKIVNSCINDCEREVAEAWINKQSDGSVNCNCGGQFGNQVVIESTYNGRKIYARYAHMAAGSVKVSVGDHVTYNTILGVMGTTGMSTARHLHLELHWDSPDNPKFEPTDIFTDNDVKGTICGRSVSNPTDNEGEENDENTEVE